MAAVGSASGDAARTGADPACTDAAFAVPAPDVDGATLPPASRAGTLSRVLDALSERWDRNPPLWTIAPLCVAAWEAMMFSRAAFLGLDRNIAGSSALLWALFALAAASVFALLARRRWPLATLLFEGALQVAGAWLGLLPYLYVPLLVALYACVARASWPRALGGLLACVVLCLAANVLDAVCYSAVVSISVTLLSPVFQCGVIGSLGVVSHVRHDRRAERQRAAARERSRQAELARMAAARDAALARGRIAAELHDSVGHDLTAIIALSEGLAGATGDAELDRAIATINELARAGLADTRSAVRALRVQDGAGEASGGAGVGDGASLHRWDEIDGVLATARATGVVAALSEVGLRTSDAHQADLAFSVSREAVTNAMRHGCGVGRVTVLWDHRPDGACEVFVRDDGQVVGPNGAPVGLGLGASGGKTPPGGSPAGLGGGLARLASTVRAVGGLFEAGPSPDGGWCVHAVIPALTSDSSFDLGLAAAPLAPASSTQTGGFPHDPRDDRR